MNNKLLKDINLSSETIKYNFKVFLAHLNKYPSLLALFICFLILFVLGFFIFFSEYISTINFIKKEKVGIRYNQHLKNLLESILYHKIIKCSSFESNEITFNKRLTEKTVEINSIIKQINKYDAEINPLLNTTQQLTGIINDWKRLESEMININQAMCYQRHDEITDKIIDMFLYVSGRSNLILDPEHESYYLIEMITNSIPIITDDIAKIKSLGMQISKRDKITTEQKDKIVSLKATINQSLEKLQKRVAFLLKIKPETANIVKPHIDNVIKRINDYLSFIDNELFTPSIIYITPSEYFQIHSEIIIDVFTLYDVISNHLTSIIEDRYNKTKRDSLIFLFSGIALFMTFIVCFGLLITNFQRRKEAEVTLIEKNEEIHRYNIKLLELTDASTELINTKVGENINIYNKICDIAFRFFNFKLVWLAGIKEDSGEIISIANSGVSQECLSNQNLNKDINKICPVINAIKSNKLIVINDLKNSHISNNCEEIISIIGCQSILAIPLLDSNNNVMGSLNFYSNEKDFFNKNKIALLQAFTNQASTAIENSRLLTDLEKEVQKKLQKIQQQQEMLLMQNRQAEMGEMISNIAHQWRQPLSGLSLLLQDLRNDYQEGMLDDKSFNENISTCLRLIQELSNIIEVFRKFFMPNKVKTTFSVCDALNEALFLVSAGLKNENIEVKINIIEDSTIMGFKNEYSQAIINIINNAKDALLENKIENPIISIDVFRENNRSVVTITDNGGGIREDVIDKIFDKYYTTKENRSGTGIGLFISKTIIHKNMNGSISVINKDGGAQFKIVV